MEQQQELSSDSAHRRVSGCCEAEEAQGHEGLQDADVRGAPLQHGGIQVDESVDDQGGLMAARAMDREVCVAQASAGGEPPSVLLLHLFCHSCELHLCCDGEPHGSH